MTRFDCYCQKKLLTGSGLPREWVRSNVFQKKKKILGFDGVFFFGAFLCAATMTSQEALSKSEINSQFCCLFVSISARHGPAVLRNRAKRWARAAAGQLGLVSFSSCACRVRPVLGISLEAIYRKCCCAALIVMFDQKAFKNIDYSIVQTAFARLAKKQFLKAGLGL